MSNHQVLEIQQGIWIDEQWIRQAGLGGPLQVVVQPGEIRIKAVEVVEPESLESGWSVFRTLGQDAPPGQLPNAAVEHDRILYRKDL